MSNAYRLISDLRKLREADGRSVSELAALTGVHINTWYRMERGGPVTVETLQAAVDVLGLQLYIGPRRTVTIT